MTSLDSSFGFLGTSSYLQAGVSFLETASLSSTATALYLIDTPTEFPTTIFSMSL